jgi:hypothetical protein
MGKLSNFRPGFLRSATDDVPGVVDMTDMTGNKLNEKHASVDVNNDGIPKDEPSTTGDTPDEDAQRGVRMAEAITLTWTKKSLATVFIL